MSNETFSITLPSFDLIISFHIKEFGLIEIKFSNSNSGAHFGGKISEALSQFLNSKQNVFEIVTEDFLDEEEATPGYPIFDLLIVNCIMSFLEE